jgi:hypothetical protein
MEVTLMSPRSQKRHAALRGMLITILGWAEAGT